MRCLVLSVALCAPGIIAWSQNMSTDTDAPVARGVAWHGPQGDVQLRASFLFPRADAHYAIFPTFLRRDRWQPVVTEGRVSITDSMPSLAVQGFGPGTDWTLVKMRERRGMEVLHIVSHSPWGDGFFSDEPFSADDIVAVTQSSAGDTYVLRPASPLSAGGYVLCGRTAFDQGGWGRLCYDFQVTGGAGS